MKVSVIIPAAGLGTRMGRSAPEKEGISRKQFMLLNGSPILIHTIRKFESSPLVTEIVVALRGDDLEWAKELFKSQGLGASVRPVEGGESRQQSVENALASIKDDTDLVAVHDAVRPFVSREVIEKTIHEANAMGAAIVGIVPVDTVKQVQRNKVRATLPREKLILTQTPQVFRLNLLRQAFEKARQDQFTGTDESSLVERLEDVEVSVVMGSDRNIKITRPTDMDLARLYLALEGTPSKTHKGMDQTALTQFRIGQGWDTHRTEPGRALILGGVHIPSEFGLAGHSDADVLFHAVTDALLGALALGDIGMHFPDTAAEWKSANSEQFLRHALELVAQQGYALANVDSTIILERPKLKDFRASIRENLARVLSLPASCVGVKFKTAEKVGPVGEGRSCEAQAAVLVSRIPTGV